MTDRDRWWMTATVWMEARGESRQGKLAVAYVILNRLRSGKWGERAGEVCLAAKQFSCWDSTSPTRKALACTDEHAPSWLDSAEAVRIACAGEKPDPTGNALHYYNPDVVRPFWDTPWLSRIVIGHHVFVRDVP